VPEQFQRSNYVDISSGYHANNSLSGDHFRSCRRRGDGSCTFGQHVVVAQEELHRLPDFTQARHDDPVRSPRASGHISLKTTGDPIPETILLQ